MGRMAVEIISWSIFTKECCQTGGSNPQPSAYQAEAHPAELASLVILMSTHNIIIMFLLEQYGKRSLNYHHRPTSVSLQIYCEMSRHMAKPTKWPVHLRSACAPVWSESSLCAHWVAKVPWFLHADSKDSHQTADAQADLSLRWV